MGVLSSLQVLPRPCPRGHWCVVIQAHPRKAPSPGFLALPWALLSLRLHHIPLIPCQGFRVLMAEWQLLWAVLRDNQELLCSESVEARAEGPKMMLSHRWHILKSFPLISFPLLQLYLTSNISRACGGLRHRSAICTYCKQTHVALSYVYQHA